MNITTGVTPGSADATFERAMKGPFSGVLWWTDFDDLMRRLGAAAEGWHVYDVETAPPAAPAPADAFRATLAEIAALMAEARARRDVCGAVYVDDPAAPAFIKVFDPFRMGSSCGGAAAPARPRWLLTRMRPDPLPEPEPAPRPGLFSRLTGKG